MMKRAGIFLATFFFIAGAAMADPTLRVSVGNWEPYIGQDLPDEGMAAVILRESFANAGYDIELDFLPWKRAFGEAQDGHYDASYLWADREERREHFYYSIPVIVTTNVFFYRRDSNFDWDDYGDLSQYNIGGVLGYQYSKEWVEAVDGRQFHPIMINSDKIGFDMLKVGRLDAFPASYLVGLDILRSDFSEQQRHDILVHRRKITVHGLHLIVAKTIPHALDIVADFNRGYSKLAKEGRFRKIALQYLSLDKEENTSNVLPE
ncbi:hypothetical protein BTA51_07165 [Hahella sp. CCB-MM4]|uniref:substrate-binding periplasmic protein n=1 Tax=Hahella sp. (strain CCB-MM4) TaxID=1926491 RepID=UPI000BD31F8F|nr:transporter substrate-binding domain-containing protein [Hahella sp. CCB-MM4]OZG74743.1 hypothetical protein BTA51_07165 [Hahella sp. CCB-MM4]